MGRISKSFAFFADYPHEGTMLDALMAGSWLDEL
jgi:hypothetical protein